MRDDLRKIDFSGRLEALIDFVTVSHRRAALALIAFSLICFLPGINSLSPTNRDESRYAQATKQMFESGDFIDIRYQDVARYRKPIGIYWLQAASVAAAEKLGFQNARTRIIFYRIPSLIAAVSSVLLTYWAALVFVRRRYALLAALAMAGSLILGVEARIATIDASLLLAALAAEGALARFYLLRDQIPPQRQWRLAAIFWTAIGASILLKGPIIPGVVALTALTLVITDRSAAWLRQLKFLPGVIWMLVLTLPWFIAILFKTEGSFYGASVGGDFFGKFAHGAEGHGAPPGYYFLLFWFAFFPAAQLSWLAAPYAWKNRADPAIRFLLAWFVPAWIVFELVITKLPHYVLPLYPAAAILIALALDRGVEADRHVLRGGWFWPIVTTVTVVAVVIIAYQFDGKFGRTFIFFAILSILLSFAAWRWLVGKSAERALAIAVLASAALEWATYSTLPRARTLFITPLLVDAIKLSPCPNPLLASTFHEASMVFLAGTDTKLVYGPGAADFLGLGGCRLAFVERREERAFANRAAEIGLSYARVGEVSGFNYPDGKYVSYLLLVPKDFQQPQ
ncbi:MAG TPA: glycosyltransferase family 39 protein [Xanthobacteraceae bacterium]|nr:glycosyltransferase family 39 protein [Xanthobacteraceae bacterium]